MNRKREQLYAIKHLLRSMLPGWQLRCRCMPQAEAAERAREVFPQFSRLNGLFMNTGVEMRYTVEPREWYLVPRSWEERTASFLRHALTLLEDVATRSVAAAGLEFSAYFVVLDL